MSVFLSVMTASPFLGCEMQRCCTSAHRRDRGSKRKGVSRGTEKQRDLRALARNRVCLFGRKPLGAREGAPLAAGPRLRPDVSREAALPNGGDAPLLQESGSGRCAPSTRPVRDTPKSSAP